MSYSAANIFLLIIYAPYSVILTCTTSDDEIHGANNNDQILS